MTEPLTKERFERFIFSFAVVITLRDRAWASASFIEYILLSFSQIDATLRMALVLKGQLDRKDASIEERLLTENMHERAVFKRALKEGVIGGELADKLGRLYDFRNAVVHRFLITDIDYEAAKRLASQLEPLIEQLTEVLRGLEDEQARLEVGMTRAGRPSEAAGAGLEEKLAEHLALKLGDTPEKLENVRDHKWPDVEDIVDFAVRKGLIPGPPDHSG